MLLQKYWALVTQYYAQNTLVGQLWGQHMKGRIWGFNPDLRERDYPKAWQNHKMQPGRGFFSPKHTCNRDSLYELADGFYSLHRKYEKQAEKSIRQIAEELFRTEEAAALQEAHGDEIGGLMKSIEAADDSLLQTVAALTAVFWFCFSIRARDRKMYQEWKDNPKHDIPCPENRYNTILAYLYYRFAQSTFYPEDKWVEALAFGYPDPICPKMTIGDGQNRVSVSYDAEKGLTGVPSAWKGLLELHAECPELFRDHYHDIKTRSQYNSQIVGLLHSEVINCVPRKIKCACYEIDYLSHRVLEDVVGDIAQNRPELLESLGIDLSKFEERELGWLRTSVGTNTIIEIPKDKKIVLHVRGQSAEYGNAGKIYPSVVETIDLVKQNRDFGIEGIDPVTACVTRGLEEEVGLPDCLRAPDKEPAYQLGQIRHVAFARTRDFHQDNFFSIVTLNPDVGMDDVRQMANHAREHKKEIRDIFAIPSNPIDVIEYMIANEDRMIDQTRYALWLYVLECKKQKGSI